MIHKPIQLKDVCLSFPHKTCFDDFNADIRYGSRIAIIGRNGSGKSTLLKMIQKIAQNSEGVQSGYVAQVIEDFETLSGGQRFNKALTHALAGLPNLLLLDEPTNHLDLHNRKSLLRMLRAYTGTLMVISHDGELLRQDMDTLWHIDNGKIHIFSGNYDDYLQAIKTKRATIEQELVRLGKQKDAVHQKLMKEQERAAKSRAKGQKSIEERKWPTIVSDAKMGRSQETSGRKKTAIKQMKQELNAKLAGLRLPEIIKPKFSLQSAEFQEQTIVSINAASVGYHAPLLCNIHLSLMAGERIAIKGDNGSGKTTLIKAILDMPQVIKTGTWIVPKQSDIGYLDQQYGTLCATQTVLETMEALLPSTSHTEIRFHLNDFLFRKNEEVNALVSSLSGGEKVRLSLAQIAAKTPKLLILDEVTNNLDSETREHVIQVIKEYPGALIVISHDEDFLKAIGVNGEYYSE